MTVHIIKEQLHCHCTFSAAPSAGKKRNVIVWLPSHPPCLLIPVRKPIYFSLLLTFSLYSFQARELGEKEHSHTHTHWARLTHSHAYTLKRQKFFAVMQIQQSVNAQVRNIFELNEALPFCDNELQAVFSMAGP